MLAKKIVTKMCRNLSLKIMCLLVSYKKKVIFGILKVTEERSQIQSWIRIQIWIHKSEVRIRGSGAPKCNGSPKQILWLERLTASGIVATVLGSIPASSDTVESEGRQIKQ
jgi:hypothetical protein